MSQLNQPPQTSSQSDLSINKCIDASAATDRPDEHFIERHATFLERIKEAPIELLFLGDSITRRWAEVPELWNQYFAKYQSANFGVGGDATQNLLWRIQNGEIDNIQPRVIVLLIGTNNAPTNTEKEITAAIYKIIDIIKAKLPETKILLLAILPRGPQRRENADEDNPYYMDIINTVNDELEKLDDGKNIRFLDMGSSFVGPDGNILTSLMPDQLHLIEPGYKIWGELMKDILEEMTLG